MKNKKRVKIRITNKRKFVLSILFVVVLVSLIYMFFSKTSMAYKELEYDNIIVSKGETLWNIAKKQSIDNDYYKKQDIRDIVDSLIYINELSSCDLKEGQQLKIPMV